MVFVHYGKTMWQLKTLYGQNAVVIKVEAGDTNYYLHYETMETK